MPFVKAGPAEILRASQKDDIAIKTLQERLERVFLYVVDIQTFVKHKATVQCLGQFLYYLNTTLAGLQTMGEEYTGIVQVDPTLRRVPPKLDLWVMVLLECLGSPLMSHMNKVGEQRIQEKKKSADEAERAELNFFSYLLKIIPLFSHLHKALFFYSCGTYHLSKRIAGIHYVLVRFWLKDRNSLKWFRLMGLVSTFQLFTLLCMRSLEAIRQVDQLSTEAPVDSGQKSVSSKHCVICMEAISSPTATSCGHIFCWKCITEWSESEERCPVCRETIHIYRLVPLRNYL